MRLLLRFVGVVMLVLAGWAPSLRLAQAANLDTTLYTAARFFGQPNFTNSTANYDGVRANSLNHPFAMALDAYGDLYVADNYNHRVLEYDAPLTSAIAASRHFGQ